jgi:hypothetical protein
MARVAALAVGSLSLHPVKTPGMEIFSTAELAA